MNESVWLELVKTGGPAVCVAIVFAFILRHQSLAFREAFRVQQESHDKAIDSASTRTSASVDALSKSVSSMQSSYREDSALVQEVMRANAEASGEVAALMRIVSERLPK